MLSVTFEINGSQENRAAYVDFCGAEKVQKTAALLAVRLIDWLGLCNFLLLNRLIPPVLGPGYIFLLRSRGSNTPSFATIKLIISFVDTPLLAAGSFIYYWCFVF